MRSSNSIRLLGVLILTLLAIIPPSVSAAPIHNSGEISLSSVCYDGAVDVSGTLYPNQYKYTRELRASSRCADINFKLIRGSATVYVTAVRCSDNSPFTSEKRVEYNNRWYVIASNVIDGTCFQLRIRTTLTQGSDYFTGKVAS